MSVTTTILAVRAGFLMDVCRSIQRPGFGNGNSINISSLRTFPDGSHTHLSMIIYTDFNIRTPHYVIRRVELLKIVLKILKDVGKKYLIIYCALWKMDEIST